MSRCEIYFSRKHVPFLFYMISISELTGSTEQDERLQIFEIIKL